MKKITLRADGDVIEGARLRAAREGRTLDAAFREWLERYAGAQTGRPEYEPLMQ